MNKSKKVVWGGALIMFIALPAFAQVPDTDMQPRRCVDCTTAPTTPQAATAAEPVQQAPAPQAVPVPDMSAPYQRQAMPPPVVAASAGYAAQTELQAAQARWVAYQSRYGIGSGMFGVTAPSRMGAPSALNMMGYRDPNMPYYSPYGYGYGPAGVGVYAGVGNYGYGGYGYGGYQSADAMYRMMFRDPRHMETHGLLKIDGPDGFLRKVRVVVNGADIAVASKHNEWWNSAIAVPAGEVRIDFIREDRGKITTVTRERVLIVPAAVQLSLTGKLSETKLRISQNEVETAERQAQLAGKP